MTDFVTLTCPTCGGKLQISNDIDRFACSYCGNEQIVRRSGGIIYLTPVIEALGGVKEGVDKTASELAILRLEKEIVELERQKREVLGKSLPSNPIGLWSGTLIFLGLITIISSFPFLFQGGTTGIVFGLFLIGLGGGIAYLKYMRIREIKLFIQTNLMPI